MKFSIQDFFRKCDQETQETAETSFFCEVNHKYRDP